MEGAATWRSRNAGREAIVEAIDVEPWKVFDEFDAILAAVASRGDERLAWQARCEQSGSSRPKPHPILSRPHVQSWCDAPRVVEELLLPMQYRPQQEVTRPVYLGSGPHEELVVPVGDGVPVPLPQKSVMVIESMWNAKFQPKDVHAHLGHELPHGQTMHPASARLGPVDELM